MTTAQVVREPLYRTVPDCRTSFGDLAARVGVELGLPPDAEQQVALDALFAETEPGIPRYRHVCVVATRQQLKSATLTIASATDLLLLGTPGAVWTAHQSKTATKSYEDLSRRIREHPEYREVAGFRAGRGEEAIYLLDDPGISLEYRARSGGSGRGFTTERLTLDEALYLRAGDIGALAPTMLTRRGGQIRYGSSAGLPGSEVLRSLRDDGRAGTDPGLWYVEYGSVRRDCESDICSHRTSETGCALDDRDLWWQSCPAMWCDRVREEDVADLRRRMPPAEFAREVLGWWDEPSSGSSLFDLSLWHDLADPKSVLEDPITLSVELPLDRSRALVGSAGPGSNGRPQVEIAKSAAGTEWVVPWLERNRAPVVVDAGNEAASLIPAMEKAGLTVIKVNGAERAQACGTFYDSVTQGNLAHLDDPEVTAAVAAAVWKESEGARSFSRRRSGGDIAPLYAVTLALHGHLTADKPPPNLW